MSQQRASLCGVILVLVLVLSGSPHLATGADYPTKPINLIVPFPPGGGADTIGRPLASVAHQHLGQPMVVLNKAGGGGAVGTQFVANAKPDGYTLLYSLNTVSEMPHIDTLLGRPLSFKKEQFIPIGQITVTPFAIMVNAESPWKTFPEFVAAAKQKPEAFQYASAGVYSTTHIMWERMLLATGLKVRHMPTTGGGPIMTAVLAANTSTLDTAWCQRFAVRRWRLARSGFSRSPPKSAIRSTLTSRPCANSATTSHTRSGMH